MAQKLIVVFFDESTGDYFFSDWHEQPADSNFIPTSFSVPHEHGSYGRVIFGEDVISAYYPGSADQIGNPDPGHEPMGLARLVVVSDRHFHMMFNGRRLCPGEVKILPRYPKGMQEPLVMVEMVTACGCIHSHAIGGTYSCSRDDLTPVDLTLVPSVEGAVLGICCSCQMAHPVTCNTQPAGKDVEAPIGECGEAEEYLMASHRLFGETGPWCTEGEGTVPQAIVKS